MLGYAQHLIVIHGIPFDEASNENSVALSRRDRLLLDNSLYFNLVGACEDVIMSDSIDDGKLDQVNVYKSCSSCLICF